MHIESTLNLLETVTVQLGHDLRKFRDVTCAAFHTVELKKEAAARNRRQNRVQMKASPTAVANNSDKLDSTTPPDIGAFHNLPQPLPHPQVLPGSLSTPTPPTKERKQKKLNMSTYKFHALPDYVRTIRLFGTTDSYSTQTVSPPCPQHCCDHLKYSF
jgi:hypothetical protein